MISIIYSFGTPLIILTLQWFLFALFYICYLNLFILVTKLCFNTLALSRLKAQQSVCVFFSFPPLSLIIARIFVGRSFEKLATDKFAGD